MPGQRMCWWMGNSGSTADPHVNNWLHCNAVLVFQEKETAAHTVRIQMSGENLDKKFTILGFGYVE